MFQIIKTFLSNFEKSSVFTKIVYYFLYSIYSSFFIFRLKTGALIESAMMIGAILAGASKEDVKSMQKIAGKIGMAFQIQDDILDVTSTTEQLGKPVHSDEKNEKTTYVTLKGIEQAHKDVERMTEEAIDELKKFPAGDNFLEQLLKSLVYREK